MSRHARSAFRDAFVWHTRYGAEYRLSLKYLVESQWDATQAQYLARQNTTAKEGEWNGRWVLRHIPYHGWDHRYNGFFLERREKKSESDFILINCRSNRPAAQRCDFALYGRAKEKILPLCEPTRERSAIPLTLTDYCAHSWGRELNTSLSNEIAYRIL